MSYIIVRRNAYVGLLISLIIASISACSNSKKEVQTEYLKAYFSNVNISEEMIQYLEYREDFNDNAISVSELYATSHSANIVLEIEGEHAMDTDFVYSIDSNSTDENLDYNSSTFLLSTETLSEKDQSKLVLITFASMETISNTITLKISDNNSTCSIDIPIQTVDKDMQFSDGVHTTYINANALYISGVGSEIEVNKISASLDDEGQEDLYLKDNQHNRVVSDFNLINNSFTFLYIFESPIDVDAITDINIS